MLEFFIYKGLIYLKSDVKMDFVKSENGCTNKKLYCAEKRKNQEEIVQYNKNITAKLDNNG